MSGTPPTPAIPSFTAGQLLSQTQLNAISSNLTNLYNETVGGFRTLKPICALRITTNTHALANNTDTVIQWDSADVNYDSMWNSTNNDHMTIQTAGVYRLYGQVVHVGPFASLDATICVNGTNKQTNGVGANAITGNKVNCGATVALAVGATVYLTANQATGGSINLAPDWGGCKLVAEWISP